MYFNFYSVDYLLSGFYFKKLKKTWLIKIIKIRNNHIRRIINNRYVQSLIVDTDKITSEKIASGGGFSN